MIQNNRNDAPCILSGGQDRIALSRPGPAVQGVEFRRGIQSAGLNYHKLFAITFPPPRNSLQTTQQEKRP